MIKLNLQLFGGRGADSGDNGAGEFGAGMENASSTTSVLEANPLTDEIGKGGGSFANEIMSTRDAFEAEYGPAVKNMNLFVAKFSDRSALGAYGGDTLFMNKSYVKNKNLTNAMKDTGGFHPGIGNKTGAEAVAAHEIGHRLGEVASKKAGISEREIVARAGRTVKIKTSNMAGHISGYARRNYGETIAEASADVFCNGSKASKASQAIMAEIKKILK